MSVRYRINVILLYSLLCFSLINKNHDADYHFDLSQSYESKVRIEVVEESVVINNGYKMYMPSIL